MPKREKAYMDGVRDRLADVAFECFLRNGLADTSTRDICARAGVSMGTLYTHFADKNALLEEALPRIAKMEDFAPLAESWRTFEVVYIGALKDLNDPKARCNIALNYEIASLVARGTEPLKGLVNTHRIYIDRIADMLRTYAANGEISLPLGEKATANAIAVWLMGCVYELTAVLTDHDIGDYIEKALQVARHLVGAIEFDEIYEKY